MAVIRFTAADALQTTTVPADIYPSEITQITGPTKSGSGKSTHFFVDIAITDGRFKGKTRTVIFNSGTNNISMLGDMQFFPQAYFLIVDSAITGREVKPEEFDLDTEALVHKPFDAAWGVMTVDGHIVNVINSFHPAGYKSSAPAF